MRANTRTRAPQWRVRALGEYYAWTEAVIEKWGDNTKDKAVAEFKHTRGYSHRRSLTSWLPSDKVDEIISLARKGPKRGGVDDEIG